MPGSYLLIPQVAAQPQVRAPARWVLRRAEQPAAGSGCLQHRQGTQGGTGGGELQGVGAAAQLSCSRGSLTVQIGRNCRHSRRRLWPSAQLLSVRKPWAPEKRQGWDRSTGACLAGPHPAPAAQHLAATGLPPPAAQHPDPATAFLVSSWSRSRTSSAAARLHCGGSGQACMAGRGHPERPARGAVCPHRHSDFPLEQGGDVPQASQEGRWKRLDLQRAGGPSAASPATVTHGVNMSQLQRDLPPLSLARH